VEVIALVCDTLAQAHEATAGADGVGGYYAVFVRHLRLAPRISAQRRQTISKLFRQTIQ
jgi:hypothetical protein